MSDITSKSLFVGRVSHAVGVVWPDNLEKVMAQMGRALGVEFEGPFLREETGLLAGVAAAAGIELISPSTPDHTLNEYLEKNGEGWYSIGFGVASTDEALERAKQLGYDQSWRAVRTGVPGWAGHYDRVEATVLDRSLFGGLQIVFATFEGRE
ncbi:MAG TPA: VOC family protein [Novosphingobium sp.]|nr:VOC family protein [Novosphingobium sp.]